MEKYISIEQVLDQQLGVKVGKMKSSVINGVLVLIFGVLLFAAIAIVDWAPSSNVPHFLLMLAIGIIIYGCVLLLIRKCYYVVLSSGQRLKNYEIFFVLTDSQALVKSYTSGDFREVMNLKRASEGGLKIRILATSDFEVCYSQVFGYEPYNYVALSEVLKHSLEDAMLIKSMIE